MTAPVINPQLNQAKNYLVPSSGTTHAVTFAGIYSASPFSIDWRQFSVDSYPFSPQGVFIDNSQGTGNLTINFQPLNFNVVCPAGISGQFQFPAIDQQTCTIVGLGQASVVFVDFPVLPNAGSQSILNTVNVDIVSPNPLPASIPVSVAGAPYQVGGISDPSKSYFAITPSDAVNFATNANSIYVGGAGDVVAVTPAGVAVTFKAVPVGSILPIQAERVNATGTTATFLVGL